MNQFLPYLLLVVFLKLFICLGFAYILLIVALKESGPKKVFGQILSVAIIGMTLVIFVFSISISKYVKRHHKELIRNCMNKHSTEMKHKMDKNNIEITVPSPSIKDIK